MKVVLSKDHSVLGKKGDKVDVSDKRAEYLRRVGAVDGKEKKVVEEPVEKSEPVDAEVKKEAPKKKEVKVVEPVKQKKK